MKHNTDLMQTCIFCQIIHGEIKSYPIYENEAVFVFLDKLPLFHGHCLVVPKNHIETVYDLPVDQVQIYFEAVRKIGKAIEQGMHAQGSFVAINNTVSQSVPHLHTHIIPRNAKDGLKGFFWPRNLYPSESEILATQNKIKAFL